MRGWNILTVILIIAAGYFNCSPDNFNEAPKVLYGQDPCAECYMIINEKRFAAAIKTREGETFRFDDVGCLVNFMNKNELKDYRVWVAGFASEQWLPAEKADFILNKNITTPMGFGILAFADESQIPDSLKLRYQTMTFAEIAEKIVNSKN